MHTFKYTSQKERRKLIEAWIAGRTIEYYDGIKTTWFSTQEPYWRDDVRYRIKPIETQEKRPFGGLSKEEQSDLLSAVVNGAQIEYLNLNNRWCTIEYPHWTGTVQYRIKQEPQEKRPFGGLSKEEQRDLFFAWLDGEQIEYKDDDMLWHKTKHPYWYPDTPYRVNQEPQKPKEIWANEYKNNWYQVHSSKQDAIETATNMAVRTAVHYVEQPENM